MTTVEVMNRVARRLLPALLLGLLVTPLLGAVCDRGREGRVDPDDARDRTQVGELTVTDKGTTDVRGMTVVRVDADMYAFTPTYLRGDPGQQLQVVVENTNTDVTHNFTLTAQQVVQDIPPNRAIEVDLTMPPSGGQLFLCTYHATQGMKGQLLAGDATP